MEKDILSIYADYTPSQLLEREITRAIPRGIHLIYGSFSIGKTKSLNYIYCSVAGIHDA
jgi:hypothetical protein